MVHENRGKRIIHPRLRTNNRIRSPRLIASGQHDNVDKGSRQNRSVTSGKGLALRIEYLDPFENWMVEEAVVSGLSLWTLDNRRMLVLIQLTINSELKRTRGIQLFNKNIAL